MLKNILKRLLFGGCCALLLGFLTVAVGQARVPNPIGTPDECLECHEEVVDHWQENKHGTAATDPIFLAAWEEAGQPEDCMGCHATTDPETGEQSEVGITCNECHSLGVNSPNHPEQIMLTDTSSRKCGTCHVETFNEWEVSEHGKEEMTCNKCHNPHTAAIKKKDVQTLCSTCHTEESHFFTYTGHAEEGLMCTDCHLQVENESPREGHSQRMHTFMVNLKTCNECHEQEMHMPSSEIETAAAAAEATAACVADETATVAALLVDGEQPVAEEPVNANPFNFALLAGAIGLAFGVVGSPWIERWLRRSEEEAA